MTDDQRMAKEKGERAENVATWYFRLNGFLSIPGYVIHLDSSTAYVPDDGIARIAKTEADFMGVRFYGSREEVGGRSMKDNLECLGIVAPERNLQALFILVEVKAGLCRMNGPWSNPNSRNMERVVRRLGFATDESQVKAIAAAMYSQGFWGGERYAFQYICVGKNKNSGLKAQFPRLIQIDWEDIASFLFNRFSAFPEKLPGGHIHEQWPDFGREYGAWFSNQGKRDKDSSHKALLRYIETGRMEL